jgi:hypothetical protein
VGPGGVLKGRPNGGGFGTSSSTPCAYTGVNDVGPNFNDDDEYSVAAKRVKTRNRISGLLIADLINSSNLT